MKKLLIAASSVALMTGAASAQVNVAFFLEWATPNQIAKVENAYDDALGIDVNWTNFNTGVAMSEAMIAGEIDISYSQGLAPFVSAVASGAPLKMVSVAVEYPPNKCFVADSLSITADNAADLEGHTVAVPLNTMADFSFRKQMDALGIDVSTLNVIDQDPASGAVALAEGAVSMACIFGGDSAAKADEVGTAIMDNAALAAAGIQSFDVVSVTESFAAENPDLVREFLAVTAAANIAFTGSEEQFAIIAADAGMSVETTKNQMSEFNFPTVEEQQANYFGPEGNAAAAAASLGLVFGADDAELLASTIDGSFL